MTNPVFPDPTLIKSKSAKIRRRLQRPSKPTRPEPNTFKVNLTDVEKDELARKCVELEGQMCHFAKSAIRWWMKTHHPEEHDKHEMYNDWQSCFLNRKVVVSWGKNMRKYGDHKKRRPTKWDKIIPDFNQSQEGHVVVKEEVISPDDLSDLSSIDQGDIQKTEATVSCEQCDYRAKSKCILRYHIEKKHTEPKIQCGQCSKLGVPCLSNFVYITPRLRSAYLSRSSFSVTQ